MRSRWSGRWADAVRGARVERVVARPVLQHQDPGIGLGWVQAHAFVEDDVTATRAVAAQRLGLDLVHLVGKGRGLRECVLAAEDRRQDAEPEQQRAQASQPGVAPGRPDDGRPVGPLGRGCRRGGRRRRGQRPELDGGGRVVQGAGGLARLASPAEQLAPALGPNGRDDLGVRGDALQCAEHARVEHLDEAVEPVEPEAQARLAAVQPYAAVGECGQRRGIDRDDGGHNRELPARRFGRGAGLAAAGWSVDDDDRRVAGQRLVELGVLGPRPVGLGVAVAVARRVDAERRRVVCAQALGRPGAHRGLQGLALPVELDPAVSGGGHQRSGHGQQRGAELGRVERARELREGHRKKRNPTHRAGAERGGLASGGVLSTHQFQASSLVPRTSSRVRLVQDPSP